MKPAKTTRRVPNSTAAHINRRIRVNMECRLLHYSYHPEEIDGRLRELDREWDIERTLEANASSLALAGLGLAKVASGKFILLPVAVLGFLLQHALRGWCPPIPVLRRMGVRTQAEIQLERYALKVLRGDFDDLKGKDGADKALAAVER
ncbi:MAG: hypothetical protein R3310_18255 [Candidatus Competibacteraceae bacterium]|nr:hypothetical protein [Candidatus Competibacteraceae bacterium]